MARRPMVVLRAMSNAPEPPISLAAARMRRHRKRRREGLRCLTIQLHETEIDVLICRALLKPEMRNSKKRNHQCFACPF